MEWGRAFGRRNKRYNRIVLLGGKMADPRLEEVTIRC